VADIRLFESLSPAMERAAQEIYDGFRSITEGLHVKTWAVERVDGSKSTSNGKDYLADCTNHFWLWGQEMTRCRHSVQPVIDVFVFGHSCRQVDKSRRKRNGWTKARIDEGLGLYCKIRGWI